MLHFLNFQDLHFLKAKINDFDDNFIGHVTLTTTKITFMNEKIYLKTSQGLIDTN